MLLESLHVQTILEFATDQRASQGSIIFPLKLAYLQVINCLQGTPLDRQNYPPAALPQVASQTHPLQDSRSFLQQTTSYNPQAQKSMGSTTTAAHHTTQVQKDVDLLPTATSHTTLL